MTIIKYNLSYIGYHFLEIICRLIALIFQMVRLLVSIIPTLPGRLGFKDKLMILIDEIEYAIVYFVYGYQMRLVLNVVEIEVNNDDEEEIEI